MVGSQKTAIKQERPKIKVMPTKKTSAAKKSAPKKDTPKKVQVEPMPFTPIDGAKVELNPVDGLPKDTFDENGEFVTFATVS